MKNKFFVFLISTVLFSCGGETKPSQEKKAKSKKQTTLPFTHIDLKDMRAFAPVTGNWTICGDAYVDRSKEKTIVGEKGTGVLVNIPGAKKRGHLVSKFQHGDIEIELDVMMPVKSNSGIYFQGRYEVQLFDSWAAKKIKYSDMGGIYQRWDKTKEKGKQGYEGHAADENAAKAPGLWQHFKIIFHAPKFDAEGNKTENAWFEEVRLNGVLIHQWVEVTGPTRAAKFADEKALGPLMIQGDHGPVALKNIKYKVYDTQRIQVSKSTAKVYDNPKRDNKVTALLKKPAIEEKEVDYILPTEIVAHNDQKIIKYSGNLVIPTSGNYLFDLAVNGGTTLVIGKDTILNVNGNSKMDNVVYSKANLTAGTLPYTLIYNKNVSWKRGFELFVEGPKMQRFSVQYKEETKAKKKKTMRFLVVEPTNKTVVQRSFLNHKETKRTHCISVGLPNKLNYSYDLETGSLLQVWSGGFLNATHMWHSRGEHQLGVPEGALVLMHGTLDFAYLENEKAAWPSKVTDAMNFVQKGYALDANGNPEFTNELNGATFTNRFSCPTESRGFVRTVGINSTEDVWHKLGAGEKITLLPDGSYLINNESFFIDFSGNENLKPIIRTQGGLQELIVNIPAGIQKITYSIIW
ncbi:3-keto-disaccharide hydrolase [Flavicella sediminum]|uniref:3-keto-disaccharide hydrolase n=1 Tax=Flavicella sediminum TaxID=2585141 RepID=UPI00112315B5|nr:DUF1080 domain-containing protein [Flavicella sediminum]